MTPDRTTPDRAKNSRSGTWLSPYLAIWGAHIRGQASYRSMFAFNLFAMGLMMAAEVVEILVYFHNTPTLGGVDLYAMLMILGLSSAAFALADLTAGHLDQMPRMVLRGELETFYTRPLPILAQVITSDLQLRRIARVVLSLGIVAFATWRSGVSATPMLVAGIAASIVCGAIIFVGLFVLAGSLQFFMINAGELANSLTYATHYASGTPITVYPAALRWVYLTVLPAGFVGYIPVVALLGLPTGLTWPGGAPIPASMAYATPLVAITTWLLSLAAWRAASRFYQGAGG